VAYSDFAPAPSSFMRSFTNYLHVCLCGTETGRYYGYLKFAIGAGDTQLYATAGANHIIKRIDSTSGVTTSVYGASGACGLTCSTASCPQACYTSSDAVCGTSARVMNIGGIGADPRGRWVYVTDTTLWTLRKINTTTWCPTTILGIGVVTLSSGQILVHPNGQHVSRTVTLGSSRGLSFSSVGNSSSLLSPDLFLCICVRSLCTCLPIGFASTLTYTHA
jgi:hypothetical protein